MSTYQFGDKSAINMMMAITNGLDREFMKRSEFTDLTSRLADVEARLSGISGGSSNGAITTIQLNGTRLPSTGGVVSINIPMQLSAYTNDANFQNAADVRKLIEDAVANGLIGSGGGSNSVRIKTTPNAVVIVKHPDGTIVTGKADVNGDLLLDLPKTGSWNVESVSGSTVTKGTVTADGNGQKTVDVTTGPTSSVAEYIVSLKTEPYATVAFVHPDGSVVTARSDSNGDLIVVLPKNGAWNIVSVGNNNIPGSVTVTKPGVSGVDISEYDPPTPSDEKYPVRTKVQPNSTVIFTAPDGTTVSAVADSNGYVTVDLPFQGNWDITAITPSENTTNGSVTVTTPDQEKDVDLSGQTPTPPTQYIVSLTVKPGATVTLIHPDGTTVTGVADSNGNLAIVVPKQGEWTILSMNNNGTTDVGNVDISEPGNNDVNVGGNTGDNPGESCTHVVEIQTTPGATVSMVHPDGTTVTAIADSNGKAVLIVPKTGDWTVVSVDKNGNINGTGSEDITGNGSSKDNVVGTGTSNVPTDTKVVSVKTDPYAQVTLVGPNGEVITGAADANGNFVTTVPKTSAGDWTVVTTNSSGTTSSDTVNVDPDKPTSTVKPGDSSGDDEEYSATVVTTPGATVYFVHPDGTTVTAVADSNGVCQVDLPKGGEWNAVAVDTNGNGVGDGKVDVGDDKPDDPTVPITRPSGTTYPVVVTTDPYATVTLVDNAGHVVTGQADENGVFVGNVPTQGTYTIVSAKDGKTATGSVSVTDGKAQTANVHPSGGAQDNDDVRVTITAQPEADIYLVDESGNVVRGTTDSSGHVTVTLPHEGDWTVVSIDPDTGTSTDTKVNVVDNGSGNAPGIDISSNNRPSGTRYPVVVTTDPGATVTVVDSGGKTFNGKADENGVVVIMVSSPGEATIISTKDGVTATGSASVSSNGTASTTTVKPSASSSGDTSNTLNIHTLASSMIIARRQSDGDFESSNSDSAGNATMTLSSGAWNIVAIRGDQCVDRLINVPTAENPVNITTATGSIFTLYITTQKNAAITAVHEDGTTVTEYGDASGFSIMMLTKSGDWTITSKDNTGANRSMLMNIVNSSHVLKLNFKTGEISGGGSEEAIVEDDFQGTITGMPWSTIYAIHSTTGDATSGSADGTGRVTIDFPVSGLWRVFSVDGSVYYDGVVIVSPEGYVTSSKIVGNTGTVFIIYITTDRGAYYTFTHTDGTIVTGQADYDSGFDTVFLPKMGTWTLVTDDHAGKTSTKNVVVENVGELLRVRSKG